MTTKTPTASGISRLLAAAGFTRAVVKVSAGGCSGFVVTNDRARDGAVRVRYRSWSMAAPAGRAAERNADYARAIRDAGWTVEAGECELVVTAGRD